MIAGGSGITPMMQVSNEILRDKSDGTKVSLLFANQTEGDILLRDELDAAAAAHGEKFAVHYTVDKAPKKWKYSGGSSPPDDQGACLRPGRTRRSRRAARPP